MLRRITKENQHLYIDSKEVLGIQDFNLNYDLPIDQIRYLGMQKEAFAQTRPITAEITLNKLLIDSDDLIGYTGDTTFSGYIEYKDKYFAFSSGILNNYSLACSVNEIPTLNANLTVLGQFGSDVPKASSTLQKNEINILNYSDIEVKLSCGNNDITLNRLQNLELSVDTSRNIIYSLGNSYPVQITTNPPVVTNITFSIKPDEYELNNIQDLLCQYKIDEISINFLSEAKASSACQCEGFCSNILNNYTLVASSGGNQGIYILQKTTGDTKEYIFQDTGYAGFGPNKIVVKYDSRDNLASFTYDIRGEVSYYLRHTKISGSTFITKDVGNIGPSISVNAIDFKYNPYDKKANAIAFTTDTRNLIYYQESGNAFSSSIIASLGINTCSYASFDFNPITTLPEVTFVDDGDPTKIKYSIFDGTTWSTSTIISGAGNKSFVNLLFDKSGRSTIVYKGPTSTGIYIAAIRSGTWQTGVYDYANVNNVHGLKFLFNEISGCLDEASRINIAQVNDTNQQLKWLKDGFPWENTNPYGSYYITASTGTFSPTNQIVHKKDFDKNPIIFFKNGTEIGYCKTTGISGDGKFELFSPFINLKNISNVGAFDIDLNNYDIDPLKENILSFNFKEAVFLGESLQGSVGDSSIVNLRYQAYSQPSSQISTRLNLPNEDTIDWTNTIDFSGPALTTTTTTTTTPCPSTIGSTEILSDYTTAVLSGSSIAVWHKSSGIENFYIVPDANNSAVIRIEYDPTDNMPSFVYTRMSGSPAGYHHLFYAKLSGSTWNTTYVDVIGAQGTNSNTIDLKYDPVDNYPAITCYTSMYPFYYYKYNGSSFIRTNLPIYNSGGLGSFTSSAVLNFYPTTNYPVIAYTQSNPFELGQKIHLLEYNGSAWINSIIINDSKSSKQIADFKFDDFDRPTIIYRAVNTGIYVAAARSGSWQSGCYNGAAPGVPYSIVWKFDENPYYDDKPQINIAYGNINNSISNIRWVEDTLENIIQENSEPGAYTQIIVSGSQVPNISAPIVYESDTDDTQVIFYKSGSNRIAYCKVTGRTGFYGGREQFSYPLVFKNSLNLLSTSDVYDIKFAP